MSGVNGFRINTFLVVFVTFAGISQAKTASFQGVGDLPGGRFWSTATCVSADGSVVVGYSKSVLDGDEAFRWENGVMTGIGRISSRAYGVSADGSVVVGVWDWLAFRWENGVVEGLGDLSGGAFQSFGRGVSADGSVVVGEGHSGLGWQAFRWEDGEMVGLGDLPGGGFGSYALGVSADGSVVVGFGYSDLGSQEAFRWENGVMVGLGDLPGGAFHSIAFAVSADGLVIVGEGYSASGLEAFRWENGTMVGLGALPGGKPWSHAYGVSADGSVIVGQSVSSSEWPEAFIWDADNGMRSLNDVLRNECGLDLTGWALTKATGISADGLTIVGVGVNPDGRGEGWIARLPEPVPVIEAGVYVDPHTLNLQSKGKWITCYIRLPEEYNIADIDESSILLEQEIEAVWTWVDEEEQIAMAKFSRSEVQSILEPGEVELTVSGELTDGTRFEGTDTIRVIDKGGKK